MLVNVAVFVALSALGIAIGVATTGSDLATPVVGSLILGVYAAAMVGIGMAVGGVFGTRFAATVVVIFVLVTWFVQIVGGILKLPDAVQQLALSSHLGQTFVGVWDWPGVAASFVAGDRRHRCRGVGVRSAGPSSLSRPDLIRGPVRDARESRARGAGRVSGRRTRRILARYECGSWCATWPASVEADPCRLRISVVSSLADGLVGPDASQNTSPIRIRQI